jgi:hypothetical protein
MTTPHSEKRETGRGLCPRPVTAVQKGVALRYYKVVLAEPGPRFLRRDVESGRATTKLKPGRRAARHTSTVHAVPGEKAARLLKAL